MYIYICTHKATSKRMHVFTEASDKRMQKLVEILHAPSQDKDEAKKMAQLKNRVRLCRPESAMHQNSIRELIAIQLGISLNDVTEELLLTIDHAQLLL